MNTLNEIQIHYTRPVTNFHKITSSKTAFELAKKAYRKTKSNLDLKEYFFILLLRRDSSVIGFHKVSEGGLSGTIADSKLIFSTCLKCLCSSVVLIHNHPSGNNTPSNSDIRLTNKLVEAGKLLDIKVLDHLIITSGSYYSFADEGLM